MHSNSKRKRLNRKLLFLAVCAFIAVSHAALRYARPDVVVFNNTSGKVFVTVIQSAMNQEDATDSDFEQARSVWIVEPGKERVFPLFFSTVLTDEPMHYTAAWKVGSRYDSEATASGSLGFTVHESAGAGRWKIQIDESSFTIDPVWKLYSYKKLAFTR